MTDSYMIAATTDLLGPSQLPTLRVLDIRGCRLRRADLQRIPGLCPAMRGLRIGVGGGKWHKVPDGEVTDVDARRLLSVRHAQLQRLVLSPYLRTLTAVRS